MHNMPVEVVKISSGLKLRKRRGFALLYFALGVLLLALLLFFTNAQKAFSRIIGINLASLGDSILYEVAEDIDSSVYEDISVIERSEGGAVASVSVDPYKANLLRSAYVNRLSAVLADRERLAVAIPLGNFSGNIFLSGRGPKVRVYAMSVGNSGADIESSFSSAGINQTVHTVYINVEITLRAVYPFSETLTRKVKIPVSETVIVGSVPGAYFGLGE